MDVDKLEETHAEWLVIATKTLTDLEQLGIPLLKVDVDVEELVSWCRQQGLPVDAHARAKFVEDKLRKMSEA